MRILLRIVSFIMPLVLLLGAVTENKLEVLPFIIGVIFPLCAYGISVTVKEDYD